MKLVHDGLTRTEKIPADYENHNGFSVAFRPLASYEMSQWRAATGPNQIDLLLGKLQSWDLLTDQETAIWLNTKGIKVEAGQPLPINRTVLGALPGAVFELLYMVVMGVITGPDGTTGQQRQAESGKN